MLDYEEIFEESETVTEETTTAVVTEVTTTPYTEVVTTQNVTEETTTVFYDEYGFEVTTSSTELEAICSYVSDMNDLTAEIEEYQMNQMFISMLTCGLLGIIIGICFVNIFKNR